MDQLFFEFEGEANGYLLSRLFLIAKTFEGEMLYGETNN